eukprot:3421581-Rhodomonas_salina.2
MKAAAMHSARRPRSFRLPGRHSLFLRRGCSRCRFESRELVAAGAAMSAADTAQWEHTKIALGACVTTGHRRAQAGKCIPAK